MSPRKIEAASILPLAEYSKVRAERRRLMSELKKNRRLEVGPFATFYFESYDTMMHQVHEMLFIEKGGTIRHIESQAVPLSLDPLPSGGPVEAVVEIAGGRAEELGISVGDRVDWPR